MSLHKTLLRPVVATKPYAASIRLASTTTSSSTTSSTPSSSSGEALTWPQYLALRHKRRIVSQVASIPTTAAAFFGGAGYFGSLEMDPTQPILGIDPMFVYGGATLGCAGLGYLIGPTIGTLLFKAFNGSKNKSMEIMDKRFYDHIKSMRVDPSYQSINNPTPDYYGEKISSFKTYRRWLRDQSAYRRKALHGMKEESDAL